MCKHSIIIFLICLFTSHLGVIAQSAPEHQGIILYHEGKYTESIRILQAATKDKIYKKDARLWNFLGLSHLENGDAKKARSALQKAVKLAPQNAVFRTNLAYAYLHTRQQSKAISELDRAIKADSQNLTAYSLRGKIRLWRNDLKGAERDVEMMIATDPGYHHGHILKSEVSLARLGEKVSKDSPITEHAGDFEVILESLKSGAAHCRTEECRNAIDQEIENIAAFNTHFNSGKTLEERKRDNEERRADPLYTPLRILENPRPGYTDAARAAGAQGTVLIAILFGQNGQMQHMIVLKRLGHGLDEQAMNAARQIKFEPAKYNGQTISEVKMVQYGFTIY